MYLFYIDASEEKVKENGMTSETFWETIKANFEENGFMQVEGAPQFFAEWAENKTLGHVWALQSAFANDLPEFVRSMTEYTVYEVGKIQDPMIREEDKERIAFLKTLDPFAGDDVTIEINSSYLDNMLHELDLIKKHGKRKSKPVNFKHLDD